MGRCCGQTFSHLPHFKQSDALAARRGVDIFIVAVRVPVVVNLLGVHNGEEVRDRVVLGAMSVQ